MRNETVLWFEENGWKLPVGILGIGSILLFVCFNPKNLRSRGVEVAKEDTSRVCVSAFFYLFDIISDIALGISFIIRGEIYWGVATFLLVLISGWLVAGYSYFHSSKKIYGENENEDNGSLAIGHVFLVGPFMHYLHYYKRMKAWTSESGENRNLRAPKLDEENDLNDIRDELLKIRALEAATEAAPQLLIQIFFIQKCLHSDSDEDCVSVLQILSLISSLLTFTYMTTRRKNLEYKSDLNTQRLFYVFFMQFLIFYPRIYFLGLFFYRRHIDCLFVYIIHWLIIFGIKSHRQLKTKDRIMTFIDVFVFDLDDEKILVGIFNFFLIGFENWVIYMATRETLQISEEIQLSVYIIVPLSIIFNFFWTIMIAPKERAEENRKNFKKLLMCKGFSQEHLG